MSATTPESYLAYLRERNYDFIVAGDDHVDYHKAFEVLYDKLGCRIIRTDSGGILTNILIEQGLVDKISLVISPCLIGTNSSHVFRSLVLNSRVDLRLINCETVDKDYISLMYEIVKE